MDPNNPVEEGQSLKDFMGRMITLIQDAKENTICSNCKKSTSDSQVKNPPSRTKTVPLVSVQYHEKPPEQIVPRGLFIYNYKLFTINVNSLFIYNHKLFTSIGDTNSIVQQDVFHETRAGAGINNSDPAMKFEEFGEFGELLDHLLVGNITMYNCHFVYGDFLYTASLSKGKIDVFYIRSYVRQWGFLFVDKDEFDPISPEYGPIYITKLDNSIFVIYSKKTPCEPSNGFISVFDLNGYFIKRFYSRGVLHSPVCIIRGPDWPSLPPNCYLVGNEKRGQILIFEPDGTFAGYLLNSSGTPIQIDGLRQLSVLGGKLTFCCYDKEIMKFGSIVNESEISVQY